MSIDVLRGFIRSAPGAGSLATRVSNMLWPWGSGFHGDRICQKMALACIDSFGVSAFVETGTFYGITTGFVASHRRSLPVYSCETNREFYEAARASLRRYNNVSLLNQSSEQCLAQLIAAAKLGGLPLFYLDAHWYDYWPLQDEIQIVTSSLERAIIVIADFQVPGREDFAYARAGDLTPAFAGRKPYDASCNYELIRPAMDPQRTYHRFLYPAYSRRQAYGREDEELVGYVVIFQNLGPELSSFARQSFVSRHFIRE